MGPLSAKFGPWETFEWFSSRGIDLKTERDGRVFPVTDRYRTVMLCYVMLCYVMLCYVMLRNVVLCYVILCYVILCYDMLWYDML